MSSDRHHRDWLEAYVQYASYGEAPPHMHFWCGVSAIAGALRRKVWIDQAYFKWHCNQYIILVAPPGIVSKSTTAGVAMNLLRQVPGVKFGPDVVTWPALVQAFSEAGETFEMADLHHTMSPVTLESSEFGNLFNPQDREMVDLFVSLWDGKQGAFEKKTKSSGNDKIVNPWINMIACTTPAWIAGNFPEYIIGGGFTSRCLFVYADKKQKLVAYPGLEVPANLAEMERALVQDLERISTLKGVVTLSDKAVDFGRRWYKQHYDKKPENLDEDRFGGYLARKQTHLHKLAMILSIARGDSLIIDAEDLAIAHKMITDLEADMPMVFSKIGRSDASIHGERLLHFIQSRKAVRYADAYKFVHANFPSAKDFEDIIAGLIRSGQVVLDAVSGMLKAVDPTAPPAATAPEPAAQSEVSPQTNPPSTSPDQSSLPSDSGDSTTPSTLRAAAA
jgi:hypothetical protein